MDSVHKKRSQIRHLMGRLWMMKGGALVLVFALLAFVPFFLSRADDPAPPVPSLKTDPKETDPKETDPKETDPKETDPKETDPKETTLPIVEGSTNAPIATATNDVPSIVNREIPRSLEEFAIIPEKDPFRLIKPEPEKMEEKAPEPVRSRGVPQLSGISTLRGNYKAVLRISPPGGGPAEYVFLAQGEALHDVEVTKVDLEGRMVEVLVRGQTFPLELDKKSKSSPEVTKSAVRPSGRNYRPEFGKASQKPTKPGEKKKPEDGKKPSSGSKPGGLKDVPLRNRNKDAQSGLDFNKPFGLAFYEKPAFDPNLQRFAMDPAELSIQREIVRGQYSREIPTDLPVEER